MNKVRITICGKEFSLKTDEAPSYFTELAKKVETEIYNMMSESDNISLHAAAILTALSAFDECQKANDSIDNIRTQIKEYVDDACQARLERDEAVKNEKAHLARISALENELKIKRMKSDINEQLTLDSTKTK
ncbi:MAG: cell division protein ZapA [Prevotella sp.]|nr:cell division protein ZapA [Prevotella sp.]